MPGDLDLQVLKPRAAKATPNMTPEQTKRVLASPTTLPMMPTGVESSSVTGTQAGSLFAIHALTARRITPHAVANAATGYRSTAEMMRLVLTAAIDRKSVV